LFVVVAAVVGWLVFEMLSLTPDLAVTYLSMLALAISPIYIGAHSSITLKAAETLTKQHAWSFPFIGSAFLFGLYLLFKLFSKDHINLLLTTYFVILGIGALTATFSSFFEYLFSFRAKKAKRIEWITIPTFSLTSEKFSFTKSEVAGFLVAIVLSIWYLMKKHWIANNIMGLAFSLQAISLLSMGSYQIGCILLGGLFFYDIFWVFGTDVMVTVAKSFDAPVKLMFPRNVFAPADTPWQFSMLGLGDIVIPGFFIALLLRFDFKNSEQQKQIKDFAKPYFNSTFIAYILGLVTTMAVMHIFRAAQPALLYLVPFCVAASLLTALQRGELSKLWSYSEEASNEPNERSSSDSKDKSSSSSSYDSNNNTDKNYNNNKDKEKDDKIKTNKQKNKSKKSAK